MLSLLAKLGLDISPFTRGLNAAQNAAAKTSADIGRTSGQELGNLLKSWIGVAAIAGFATKEFQQLAEARDKAALAGITPSRQLAEDAVLKRIGDRAAVGSAEFERLVGLAQQRLPADNIINDISNAAALMKQNLGDGETAMTKFMAGSVRFLRATGSLVVASKEAVQSFVISPLTPAPGEKGARGFKGIAEAFGNAANAFGNRLRLDTGLFAAADDANTFTPAPKTPIPPEANTKNVVGGNGREVVTDPRIAAGGLASAGLFFGGAGNPLLREAKSQTGILERSERELRGIRNAIREEL
jgi:hypothetical protein